MGPKFKSHHANKAFISHKKKKKGEGKEKKLLTDFKQKNRPLEENEQGHFYSRLHFFLIRNKIFS